VQYKHNADNNNAMRAVTLAQFS